MPDIKKKPVPKKIPFNYIELALTFSACEEPEPEPSNA